MFEGIFVEMCFKNIYGEVAQPTKMGFSKLNVLKKSKNLPFLRRPGSLKLLLTTDIAKFKKIYFFKDFLEPFGQKILIFLRLLVEGFSNL